MQKVAFPNKQLFLISSCCQNLYPWFWQNEWLQDVIAMYTLKEWMVQADLLKETSMFERMDGSSWSSKRSKYVWKNGWPATSTFQIKWSTTLKNGRLQVVLWKKIYCLHENSRLKIYPYLFPKTQYLERKLRLN